MDEAAVVNGLRVQLPALRVISVLGSGANGVVFRAHDRELDRPVAVKIYPVQEQDRRIKVEQGRAEGRKVARLDHPRIVQVFQAGVLPAGPAWFYVIMQVLDGQPLKTMLANNRLTFGQRLTIWRDVATAVRYAHARHTYHGDLHAGNVFVQRDGQAKVIDFGTSIFARRLEASRGREAKILCELCARLFPTPAFSTFTDIDPASLSPESALEACDTAVELMRLEHGADDAKAVVADAFGTTPALADFPALPETVLTLGSRNLATILVQTPVISLQGFVQRMRNLGVHESAIRLLCLHLYTICEQLRRGIPLRSQDMGIFESEWTTDELERILPIWNMLRATFLEKGQPGTTMLKVHGSGAMQEVYDAFNWHYEELLRARDRGQYLHDLLKQND